MRSQPHLLIATVKLAAGEERAIKANGWLFLHLQHGQAYWLWPPQTAALSSGELLVAAPEAQGSLRASKISDVAFSYLDFCPEQLSDLLTFSDYLHLKNCADSGRWRARTFPADHPLARNYAALCAAAEDEGGLFARFRVLNWVSEVFLQAARPRTANRAGGEQAAGQRLIRILSQMPSAEFIQCSAEELAARCGCSARHLRRLFHLHHGISLRESQTELRLQKARRLLGETNDKILHIALECGYQHISLFNALFKRRFGMPPSQWRLRHQNQPASSGNGS